MKYRLRTLLILMAIAPPILAFTMPPLVAHRWPQHPERPEIKLDFLFEEVEQGVQTGPVWHNDHANEGLYNSFWFEPAIE